MIKYAQIVDEQTKLVVVGTGTDVPYYQSIGMTQMDVEQAWDGSWYLAGYCPEKPKENILKEELAEQQDILSSTDWYAIRYADSGVEIPADIKAKRQAAREKIDELRAEAEQLKTEAK